MRSFHACDGFQRWIERFHRKVGPEAGASPRKGSGKLPGGTGAVEPVPPDTTERANLRSGPMSPRRGRRDP